MHPLAIIAETRARLGRGIIKRGMCQAWVRECYEQKYGIEFDAHHKASAELARRSWIGSGYELDETSSSVPGDILYKRGNIFNRHGHVGIRVTGNRVAENSTRRYGRVRGGIGFVSLEGFGKVDLIVRLP